MVLRRRLVAAVAIAIVAAAVWACGGPREAGPAPGSGAALAPPEQSRADDTRTSVRFRSATALDDHWRKHGREFGSISRDEYLARAQALRDGPVGGAVLEILRADGVTTRYDRASRAFIAFESDGTIRTFFRPNDGEAYFRRQARRARR